MSHFVSRLLALVALAGGTTLVASATLIAEADVLWDETATVPGQPGTSDAGTTSAFAEDDYLGTNSLGEAIDFEGIASANADYGALSTYAFANLENGDVIGGLGSSFHAVTALASFEDVVTAPARATSVVHRFRLSGSVGFSANLFGNSSASITVSLQHDDEPFPFVVQWSADAGDGGAGFPPELVTNRYDVTPGAAYTFGIDVTSAVRFFHPGGPAGSLDAYGEADFAATFEYVGAEFLDDNGATLTGLAPLTGVSGATYQIVPEPRSALLFAALAAWLRRR